MTIKKPESPTFPGGSRSRITKAGDRFRSDEHTEEDLNVIDKWRAAHGAVLNTFQSLLRAKTRGTSIHVAQRHKRLNTILDKLRREKNMALVTMDDVAGCRLIFETIDQLNEFRLSFHKSRFNHIRKNESDRYNYISKPKSSGYRGIHDVYKYNVNSYKNRHLTGLFIEIQYRTRVQHAWATANEVIGLTTANEPKFQRGNQDVMRTMALASEILARAHENQLGPIPEIDDNRELVRNFLDLDSKTELLKTLRNLNHSNANIKDTEKEIFILNFFPSSGLNIIEFKNDIAAIRALFELEKKHPENDIVLVRAKNATEVRSAFRNYFTDASEFIDLIESGCAILTDTTTEPKKLRRLFKKQIQPT